MSNHWHLVLEPTDDGQLTAFMRSLTLTHAQRWKHAHGAVGHGHLYQGRFKSFPIESGGHLLTALRYVERNPVRAGLVDAAQDWRWGSAHVRDAPGHELRPLLAPWRVPRPRNWLQWVNEPQTSAEESAMKQHIARGRPMGGDAWVTGTVRRLSLQQTVRDRGRQKGWKKPKGAPKER